MVLSFSRHEAELMNVVQWCVPRPSSSLTRFEATPAGAVPEEQRAPCFVCFHSTCLRTVHGFTERCFCHEVSVQIRFARKDAAFATQCSSCWRLGVHAGFRIVIEAHSIWRATTAMSLPLAFPKRNRNSDPLFFFLHFPNSLSTFVDLLPTLTFRTPQVGTKPW